MKDCSMALAYKDCNMFTQLYKADLSNFLLLFKENTPRRNSGYQVFHGAQCGVCPRFVGFDR